MAKIKFEDILEESEQMLKICQRSHLTHQIRICNTGELVNTLINWL